MISAAAGDYELADSPLTVDSGRHCSPTIKLVDPSRQDTAVAFDPSFKSANFQLRIQDGQKVEQEGAKESKEDGKQGIL